MKVSYPLSLKVSLWLMLNLLLLAALGVTFFAFNGGLRWDALIAGPTGARMQSLANIIAGEAAAASGEARAAVLQRFGHAYDAEFFLYNIEAGQFVGPAVELPEPVRTRVEFRPRGGPGGFGPRGGRGEKAARDAANDARHEPGEKGRPPSPPRREPPPEGRREPPGGFGGPPGFGPPGDLASGRFIVRTDNPAAYWISTRVPFASLGGGRPVPMRLVARVGSFWGLLHLIELQSWILAATGVLALSVLFWLPLVRSITRSLGQLTAATEEIAEGRFDTRVTANRRDELGKLGESVNRMAGRLDAHMNGQKRFLGDVAHELCSPLARLQLATGILAEQAPKNLEGTVADVRDEVQQMSTLVNELLAFTKSGLRPRHVVCAPVELAPLARTVLAREDAAGRIALDIAADLRVTAEPDLLARALANLIRNALRYAGDADPITLLATREGDRVILALEDSGPGVPPTELDRLGEPFFRPELARTREGGGVGLGLAIVRDSIAACGGEVRFANRTPQGFRAEIRLRAT